MEFSHKSIDEIMRNSAANDYYNLSQNLKIFMEKGV